MSRLRRSLAVAQGDRPVVTIESVGAAYALHADPLTVDVHRFVDLVATARASSDPSQRAQTLAHALGLWRGDALAGLVAADQRHRMCGELYELRTAALELRVAADLDLGRHEVLIPELARLTTEYPTRERLAAAFMIALYRAGRPTDALATYDAIAAGLVDELGLDPGPELRDLRTAILRDDAELRLVPAQLFSPGPVDAARSASSVNPPTVVATTAAMLAHAVVPGTLPAAPFGFVGRTGQLAELDQLGRAAGGRRVVAVSGSAGIGKTALVVHWAHRSRSQFPDGQLYVDLRGFSGSAPLTAVQALGALLTGLGVAPGRVPIEAPAAAALFRTLTADLRALIILDNARDAAQVRPLLAGGSQCFTAVVSRHDLGGLVAREGARPLSLSTLSVSESHDLLGSLLDEQQPGPIAELAALCAHLPLALRIAAANIAQRRELTVASYVDSLRTGDRLSALEVPDDPEAAVRTAFDLTYAALDQPARQLFRMIGTAPGQDLSTSAIAELAGAAPLTQLYTLLRHHLVEEHKTGRFTMHDLLRAYATERSAAADTEVDRGEPAARLLRHYLAGTRAANAAAYPHSARLPNDLMPVVPELVFAAAPSALAWLEAERVNLVSIATQPPAGLTEFSWLLADQLRSFFAARRYDDDWLNTARAAGRAARDSGSDTGAAAAGLCLGWAYRCFGRYPDAVRHLTVARDASRRAGWLAGQATALSYLGVVHADMGRPRDGMRWSRQALRLAEGLSWGAQAVAHNNFGVVCLIRGDNRGAAREFSLAIQLITESGALSGAAVAQVNRGFSQLLLGDNAAARRDLISGLLLSRGAGDRVGASLALTSLGLLRLQRGEVEAAIRLTTVGVRVAREVGDKFSMAYALTVRADVVRVTGDPRRAVQLAREALGIARDIANRQHEIEALVVLGRAEADAGRAADAVRWLDEALGIAERNGYRTCEGKALTALVAIHARGDRAAALEYGRRALAVHRSTGYRFGTAAVLELLAALGDELTEHQ